MPILLLPLVLIVPLKCGPLDRPVPTLLWKLMKKVSTMWISIPEQINRILLLQATTRQSKFGTISANPAFKQWKDTQTSSLSLFSIPIYPSSSAEAKTEQLKSGTAVHTESKIPS